MSIHRTDAGTYEARWRPPGSRTVKSKRFKLKKDAVAFMAKVESAKRDGTYTDLTRGKQTLEEWWREYFAHSVATLRTALRTRCATLIVGAPTPFFWRDAIQPFTSDSVIVPKARRPRYGRI